MIKLAGYALKLPIVRTITFGAPAGYWAANLMGAAPALGMSTAVIIDKVFSFTLDSDKRSAEKQNKLVNEEIVLLAGLVSGGAVSDCLFSTCSHDPSLSRTLPKAAFIYGTIKTARLIARFLPSIPVASIVKQPIIRYPSQAAITMLATKVINDRIPGTPQEAKQLIITGLAILTMAGLLITDIAYPIISSFWTSSAENPYDKLRFSPLPSNERDNEGKVVRFEDP